VTLWLIAVVLGWAYFIYSATVDKHHPTEQIPETHPSYRHSTSMLVSFVF
jgi:hypothetical protein